MTRCELFCITIILLHIFIFILQNIKLHSQFYIVLIQYKIIIECIRYT